MPGLHEPLQHIDDGRALRALAFQLRQSVTFELEVLRSLQLIADRQPKGQEAFAEAVRERADAFEATIAPYLTLAEWLDDEARKAAR